jgi:hypothetical protein
MDDTKSSPPTTFGVADAKRVDAAFDAMVLAHFDDEGYKSAEFKRRVVALPFGYRIVRPKNSFSKFQTVPRPLNTDLQGRLVDDGPHSNATLNKGVCKLLPFKYLLRLVRFHRV